MNSLTELQTIPGIGVSLSQDLLELGYSKVDDLKDQDPEAIYQDMLGLRGKRVDRCVLYVLRCAVYFASNSVHDPELLKWWNWQDRATYALISTPALAKAEYAQHR